MLSNISVLLLAIALGAGPQQPPPAPSEEPARPATQAPEPSNGPELPVDLDKIQRALSRPPAITTKSERPVFRVEVFAPKPTIEDILGRDYLRGPVPTGIMTHQEFLDMVTPTEFRGYSMFTNAEGMTIAATSMALQWAVLKAVDRLKKAQTERAKEAARQEVIAAMAEFEAARKREAAKEKRDP